MSHFDVSRRHFFFGSLLAGAVPAAGFGSVPSLKALGYKSFNEKLNIAAVGVGGRGAENLSGFLSENIVALCDVDSRQGGRTFKRFEKAPNYVDFRKMLDKEAKNIDAVVISTADHMHATVALWCMQRGKHVYVEKPLTRTPWEARLLAEAALKYKVATQMGNQGYSHEGHRTACEIIWSGEIGNVTEVHANTSSPNWPQGIQTIPKEEPVPTGLDWDLWLGCAPMRPYTSGGWDKDHVPNGYTGPYNGSNYGFYVPHDWRGFYDFGTGALGDAAIHALGPANQALALGMPIAVECLRAEHRSKFSYPLHALLRFDFPARGNMPPVSVYWSDGARDGNPENYYHPKGLENEVLLPAENNLAARGRPDLGSGSRGSSVAASALGGTPGCFSRMARFSWAKRVTWQQSAAAKECNCCPPPDGRITNFRRRFSRARRDITATGFARAKAVNQPVRISASPLRTPNGSRWEPSRIGSKASWSMTLRPDALRIMPRQTST